MKCDELKPITVTDECGSYRVYNKSEVDAAIAELKGQVNGFKNRANLWEYNAQNEHNAAVAVRMENKKLKWKLQDQCMSCPVKMQEDDVVAEKDNEIRRLKRALWLARAERAKEMCRRLLIQGFDPKWENVEHKCLKKAEEYK